MGMAARPAGRFERLLLATDGSEFSDGAIREAIRMAAYCSARLYALSVTQGNPEYDALVPQVVEQREIAARAHLEAVQQRAAAEGVECELLVRHGNDPHDEIVAAAEELQPDALIMGRRGKTGLMRIMMGSVTQKVIGYSPCNVVIVPRAATLEGKRLLVATDGSEFSDAAVAEAIAMAKRCEGSLAALYVAQEDDLVDTGKLVASEELLGRVRAAADAQGVACETLTRKGRPHEVIVATAQQRDTDLIVVGTHGRTGLQKFLMGSVAERVIGNAHCAVLVVKK